MPTWLTSTRGCFRPRAVAPSAMTSGSIRVAMGQPARTRRRTRRCGHFPARASISTLNRSYWNLVKERLSPDYVKALPTETNVFRAVRISVERQQSHRPLQIQRP